MNVNNENNMMYVVMAPHQPDTEKVFVDVVTAETYGEWLVKNDFYDYYELIKTEMN
jgi:hypothetical protein